MDGAPTKGKKECRLPFMYESTFLAGKIKEGKRGRRREIRPVLIFFPTVPDSGLECKSINKDGLQC